MSGQAQDMTFAAAEANGFRPNGSISLKRAFLLLVARRPQFLLLLLAACLMTGVATWKTLSSLSPQGQPPVAFQAPVASPPPAGAAPSSSGVPGTAPVAVGPQQTGPQASKGAAPGPALRPQGSFVVKAPTTSSPPPAVSVPTTPAPPAPVPVQIQIQAPVVAPAAVSAPRPILRSEPPTLQ